MKEFELFWMCNNLDQITRFHNHVHGFFNDNLQESQVSDEINQQQRNWLKNEYEVHLPNQLRKSVFLTMFGHFEECLHASWQSAGKPDCLKSAYGINRYSSFLSKYLGIDIGSNPSYGYIKDCQLVRNAIIHIAGRVSLSKDNTKLESVVRRNKDCFEIVHDRIYLTNEGISKFQRSVAQFTKEIVVAI
ncbi:hypothetical protein [Vibrio parahaemolyticus]|uniref:hypothetical protein n=1 Tax=Vibrio parahaemolyticus TaxID=670 RepID=UPI000C1CC99F|nr:hypothetical protein [Vibrio parahaemolyticus]EGX7690509.1 hypothetical protein [Vibrio parahaemolyticus]PIS71280.1 hypothetical protein H271_05460 [Vibrio parahaemolyticus 1911C]